MLVKGLDLRAVFGILSVVVRHRFHPTTAK